MFLENRIYLEDVETALEHAIGFDIFSGKKILILGASGLIGSFMTDCFIRANESRNAEIYIYASGRNKGRLKKRFGSPGGRLHFVEADVTDSDFGRDLLFDYIIHGAGFGHPQAFRETPVEVLLANVIGVQKILEAVKENRKCRVLYISSGEAQELTDHLTTRASYPMGKKAAETLCVAYKEEYGVDVVIARPCHTFGGNITESDNRAASQFLAAAAKGENIRMYSAGEQVRTFSYVADCVSGLLTALARGESGNVYGISSDDSCTVKEFAEKCAKAGNCVMERHAPTKEEKQETTPIKQQLVSNDGLKRLGWCPSYSIDEGIKRAVRIIKETKGGSCGVLSN